MSKVPNIRPEADDRLSGLQAQITVLQGQRATDEAAELARRQQLLQLYRELFDILAARKDKKAIRAQIPALNAFLANPRIGSALANMLFLPAGLFKRFSWWLLSSLIK